MKLKHLDLFSGIGGFALAARRVGWETVGFCEIDPYCQKVLKKHWPDVPIYEDVRKFDGESVRPIDVLTAGWPCQPHSTASRGRRKPDILWNHCLSTIWAARPRWVVLENVAGVGFENVEWASSDLENSDFRVWACDIAVRFRKHVRRRIYIVAHSNSYGEPGRAIHEKAQSLPELAGFGRSEPDPMGMDDGLSPRMDRTHRLRGLGNAIVPQVAQMIFEAINEPYNP